MKTDPGSRPGLHASRGRSPPQGTSGSEGSMTSDKQSRSSRGAKRIAGGKSCRGTEVGYYVACTERRVIPH